ncbi:enoyl-CoA hydratase/isomerase family protein [Mycolicibacterium brisbanense]|uniref:3-hydroxybutyryl-CoA dehydratase n=1 Tax=Mycolicibacterium brisbanense TaxID=146020 RepID=A0A100W610_9MYCO|nr:enoyl-CoA hydratase/isomerase family protein [Mycolicibacterium brisbanense]MCV7159469.1 enoyl-CoA hydratase/isomerase family protein [Mycolicibacterium brisbanense]GAS92256.1 3-hydroxybutyryl-CoA dehydratase [Mycolicibacterium brisbanense]
MTQDYETLDYSRRGGIGTLTLNRPDKLNALNPQMREELCRLGALLADDDTLRCLVVTGAGTSFSAGLDLSEAMTGTLAQFVGRTPDEETVALGLGIAGVFEFIPELPCPSVAAVRGHAYGAGLQLALACDFRIFAADARVGLTESRYGLLPDMGATFRLPRIVGEGRARELILLGEIIDAAEALRIGLANRVVAGDELDYAADEFAERLAAQPSLAVRGARAAIEAGRHLGSAAALRVAVEAQARCLNSADFQKSFPSQAR